MPPRVLPNSTGRTPYKTYIASSLAEVMWLVKRRRYLNFTTLFRGQRDDLPLVPSIGRINIPSDFGVIRTSGKSSWYSAPPTSGLRLLEEQLLEQFKRMAPAYTSELPSDPWEILAVAQHFGLPTRLLDWSTNPYVALWFVVSRPPSDGCVRRGVMWIHVPDEADFVSADDRLMPPLEVSRLSGDRPLVFIPRFVTPRIRAQGGIFTLHQFNERHGGFRPIDRFGDHRGCLTKVIVPTECFESMRDELNLVGVNAASLLPDLGGLCRSIVDSSVPWPA